MPRCHKWVPWALVVTGLSSSTFIIINSVARSHVFTQRCIDPGFHYAKCLFSALSADRPCHILRLSRDRLWYLPEEDVRFLLPRYCIFLLESNFILFVGCNTHSAQSLLLGYQAGFTMSGVWLAWRLEEFVLYFVVKVRKYSTAGNDWIPHNQNLFMVIYRAGWII